MNMLKTKWALWMSCLVIAAIAQGTKPAKANPSDFTVLSGKNRFQLADAKGRFVALHFLLKTECPYCLRHVQYYAAKSASVADVTHIFLKPDTESEIKQWESKLSQSGPAPVMIYRDPEAKLAKQFKIPDGYAFHGMSVHYPALVLLGPDGKEVFRYVGKSNADRLSFDKFAEKMSELTKNAALKEYNVADGKPAIQGYDPVAYIDHGRAIQGRKEFISTYRGVTYLFETVGSRERFAGNPAKYVPAYGGWCATAMAEGDKVDIDPTSFKVTDGRLFLFYKGWLGDAKKKWEGDEKSLTGLADQNWSKLAPQDSVAGPTKK